MHLCLMADVPVEESSSSEEEEEEVAVSAHAEIMGWGGGHLWSCGDAACVDTALCMVPTVSTLTNTLTPERKL